MPSLIYWNIEGFSIGKMNTNEVEEVIFSTIYPDLLAPPACELFVIVEVMARNTDLGAVPTNAGAAGMGALLTALQGMDANWRCVPPISVAVAGGRSEAVGVFYLNNVFTFTGPHVWSDFGPMPAAQIGATLPPWDQITGGLNAANAAFPAPWNVGTFVGMGPPSPQIDFPDAAGLGFVEFPLPGYRRPLRCQFTFNGGADVLDLWVLHNPPQRVAARNATFNLATLPDFALPDPAANLLRLVCGDFNLNSSNAWQYAGYGGMTALLFTPAIGPFMLLPAGTTTHFAKPVTPANYLAGGLSIDNMLKRGPIAVVGVDVIDRVLGAPNPPWPHDMFNTLANILAMGPGAAQTQAFRGWANFGHIGNRASAVNMQGRRGASDHMPLWISF